MPPHDAQAQFALAFALAPTAHQAEILAVLAHIIQPATYLEVGVKEGRTLWATLAGCASIECLILCDTWGRRYGGSGHGDHAHIEQGLTERGYTGRVVYLDGPSQRLVPLLQADAHVDLVHIDGDHSLDGAYIDLCEGWARTKVALVLHDTTFVGVSGALSRFLIHAQGVAAVQFYSGGHGTAVIWREERLHDESR